MHRRHLLFALPALLGLPARAAAPLPVVASFSILADITHEVAGPLAVVRSLVPTDGDVHVYEPRPSDLLAIRGAALVVTNGLGLEGWMTRLLPASGTKARVVVAAAAVVPRHMDEGLDPHAWQDPRNGILYVRAIADGLAAVAPDQAGAIRARADAYARRIAETDAWIAEQIATVPPPQRRILTSHDAFFYFGARYRRSTSSACRGSTQDSEPSAADIAALVRQVRAEGVKAVFVENMASPALIRTVARESGVVLGPPCIPTRCRPRAGRPTPI